MNTRVSKIVGGLLLIVVLGAMLPGLLDWVEGSTERLLTGIGFVGMGALLVLENLRVSGERWRLLGGSIVIVLGLIQIARSLL